MKTIYTFTKDGHRYSAKAANRFEAQTQLEVIYGVNLTGAKFEVVFNLKTARTGAVR